MEIKGLDKLQRKLETLENFQRALHRPMKESVDLVKRKTARAPNKAAGAFSSMATPAQKRAFWAKVRADPKLFDKRTGYRRTDQTTQSWAVEVRNTSRGVQGVVGNNSPGARYVQGRKYQQPFHRASKWPVVEDVLDDSAGEIARIFQDAVRRELNK